MKFIRSTLITFITNVFIFVLSLWTASITSRQLGSYGRGIIGLYNNNINLFLIILDLGIGAASTYFIGKEKKKINEILGSNIIITFIECIIILIIYLANLKYKMSVFKGLNNNLIILTLLSIPISSIKAGLQNILLGLEYVTDYNKSNIFLKVSNVIFITVLLLVWKSPVVVIISNIISIIIILILIIYKLFLKEQYKIAFSCKNFISMVKYGIKIQLSNIVQLLTYRLDIFIINYFLLISDVGIYSNAVAIAETMWQIPGTIATILYPTVSNCNNTDDIKEITNKVLRVSFNFIIIVSVILAFLSKPIVLFLFGKEFIKSSQAIILLIPGICVFSISKILASSIAGMGLVNINLIVSIIVSILTVILDLFFIPKFGIIGASIASSITYIFHAILTLLFYIRVTKSRISEILIITKSDISEIKNRIKSIKFS